ncbi:MAG: chemotaxis protein CheR [Bacteroidetes bacterium GWA2_31_9b]|nr:MAG: chemotaxis protein CheR [Bacteroidetes bacterium GWA2_31_9b]
MADSNKFAFYQAKLSQSEFDRLSKFIFEQSGIKLPQVKLIMLQSRLQKRLKELNFTTYKEYIDYVFSAIGLENEIVHMLDVVSTNKTDFYREPVHFDFLNSVILPEYIINGKSINNFLVWSAGCSSGEEPYTIAFNLMDFKEKNIGFDFSIIASDISSQILNKAKLAIYKEELITSIPLNVKKKYLLKSKDRTSKTIRIVKNVRDKVVFFRFNFMEQSYNLPYMFDVIFCRNVLIYFTRETQEQVLLKLCSKLKTGGYLFIGHSESILNMDLPIEQIKPTVYRKI